MELQKIKVVGECLLADAPMEEDVSYGITVTNTSNKVVWGNGYSYSHPEDEGNTVHENMNSIVAVTSGKVYQLQIDCTDAVNGITLSWGKDINNLIVGGRKNGKYNRKTRKNSCFS